jgi:hypothetical protein
VENVILFQKVGGFFEKKSSLAQQVRSELIAVESYKLQLMFLG